MQRMDESMNDEPELFSMEQGCAVHGDDHMRECSMCGQEFCRRCYPDATVCPDCSDGEVEKDDEEEEEEERGVDGATDLDELVEGDQENERVL